MPCGNMGNAGRNGGEYYTPTDVQSGGTPAALKMSILDRDGAFNQAVAAVRPNDGIDVEFILHAIDAAKPRLLLERRGVRQKNLSLAKIRAIRIALPGLEQQRAAVEGLRRVLDESRRLESIYQQKLAALEALKKSLLNQAFTGQLGSEAA